MRKTKGVNEKTILRFLKEYKLETIHFNRETKKDFNDEEIQSDFVKVTLRFNIKKPK